MHDIVRKKIRFLSIIFATFFLGLTGCSAIENIPPASPAITEPIHTVSATPTRTLYVPQTPTIPPPTPSPTLFPAYVTVCPAVPSGEPSGDQWITIPLDGTLCAELDEVVRTQRGRSITLYGEDSADEYFLETRIYLHTSKTTTDYGDPIIISNKGAKLITVYDVLLTAYDATELCDKIMDVVAQEMKWEYITPVEIHDIEKADLYISKDGELLKTVEDPAKLRQLEKLISGAVTYGVPSTYFPGPALVLTRKDGKEFTVWPTLQDDYFILEPWFFFDYGPRVNGEGVNNTAAFLSILGLKKWPDKVYQANGMESILKGVG